MTDYDTILEEAVDEGLAAFQNADGLFGCGFASIGNIDGRSGLVRHFKQVGDVRNDAYVHPTLPLHLSKNSYRGGYTLSITNVSDIASGPEWQCVERKAQMYSAALDVLSAHEVAAGGRVYSRLD